MIGKNLKTLTLLLGVFAAISCSDADTDSGTSTGGTNSGETDVGVADVGESDVTTGSTGCEKIAGTFETLGSANADLADPEVNAECDGDTVTVTANSIPDFPYIETSPGNPEPNEAEYTFPATPTLADEVTAVAAIGAIAVAINGIPIFGPTEGAGGDVLALGGGFTECGGHNGPSGYHFHTFDPTGSDDCRWSEADAKAGHLLFGYAFDGYPIYSGNDQFTSSYALTDATLFATDTWAAHTYTAGSGDLDECNGKIDADGNYAYYTTTEFPYILGCYRGVPAENGAGGGGMGGPPGGM